MNHPNHFSITLQPLPKLVKEKNSLRSTPLPSLPSLNSVLTEFAPLPSSSLFLGLATDGLPILLNLLDPLPGPIILIGDAGCGKTNFLQTVAASVSQLHSIEEVCYAVIANEKSEWINSKNLNNCTGQFSMREPKVASYLNSLVAWAHSNKGERQVDVLFIDHLESLLEIPEVQQDLRWLFLRGPSRRVWPIVTTNSSIAVSGPFQSWLTSFRTRLFGHIQDDHSTQFLTSFSRNSFADLFTGYQFAMREGNGWLPFWIPVMD